MVEEDNNEIDIVLSNEKPKSIFKGNVSDEIIIDNNKNSGYSSPDLIPKE